MASERIQRQIDRLLDEAEQAITSDDWPIVASRVRSVLANEPENGDAKAYLAGVERAIGSPQSEAELPPQLTGTSDAERRQLQVPGLRVVGLRSGCCPGGRY